MVGMTTTASQEAPERFPIKLPAGFDPTRHLDGLKQQINKMYPNAAYAVHNIDTDSLTAMAIRERNVSEVHKDTKADAVVVNLVKGTKTADGPAIAAKYEAQHPGYVLTDFEPFLLKARLTRLTDSEKHARDALSIALMVKPWDVKIRTSRDGGFDVVLPKTYVPSKHDQKLDEVVTTAIGDEGWLIQTNSKTYRARILPGDPPTFEKVYHFDFSSLPDPRTMTLKEQFSIPIGMGLAPRGQENAPVFIDFSDSVGLLCVGLAGSGKSVATQAIVFNALARGWQLALINTVDKATDFIWAKPFVKDHMWGCDSVAQSVTVAKLVVEHGEKMGALLSEHGVSKWQDLPDDVRAANPPLLLVADELAALLVAPKIPPGLPKEVKALPEFVQMAQDLLEANLLMTTLSKIPAVYRAAGIRVEYLTQQPNERYGFSTSLKGNLPHRVMLGVNPSPAEKGHAFRTPEKVPDVPKNIATDGGLARGVGLAHLDGQDPTVIKGYFAPLEKYLAEAERRKFPITLNPEPTARMIEKMVPRIDDDGGFDDDEPRGGGKGGGGNGGGFGRGERQLEDWEIDPNTGKPLDGRQRANMAKAKLARDAREAARDD